MKRWPLFLLAPTWIVLVLTVLPLALSQKTLFHSDAFNLHLGLKAATAQTLQAGELPLVDMVRTTGEPLLGNLNGLPLYPTNLLYLVAPVDWAFNAHYWLHWLLAPLAFYWLARALGLGRGGASAAAVFWSTGGYFLSQLSFYNLVAINAVAPAFIASCLESSSKPKYGPVSAVLLGLLVLAGDPFSALLTLGMAGLALLLQPPTAPFRWTRTLSFLLAGFLLALPGIVELLRIIPTSLRAVSNRDLETSLDQSLAWAFLPDFLLPFFLGPFDMSFWGKRYFDNTLPFFACLFPGFLALAAALAAGRGGEARWPWRWALVLLGGGLFFALGENNPLVVLLYREVPGFSVLRFPIKFVLPVIVAICVFGGIGFDRFCSGGEAGRRFFSRVVGALTATYVLLWTLVLLMPPPFGSWMRALEPALFAGPAFDRERARWGGTLLVLVGIGLLVLLCGRVASRSVVAAAALMLVLTSVIQLDLLGQLHQGLDISLLREQPPALSVVPADALVYHHSRNSLNPIYERLPVHLIGKDSDVLMARCAISELAPKIGAYWPRRYALAQTADYLDSYLSFFVSWKIQHATDRQALSTLSVLGVDRLLLSRDIDPEAADQVELLGRFPNACERELRVYGLRDARPGKYLMPGNIRRRANLDDSYASLVEDPFDAATTVLLSGSGDVAGRPPGSYRLIEEHGDGFELEAESAAGAVLVARRNYMPFYRAFVDGQPASPTVANLMFLGLELPPGRHHVRVEADRRPTRLAFAVAGTTALLLLVAFVRLSRAPAPTTPMAETQEGGSADPPSPSSESESESA